MQNQFLSYASSWMHFIAARLCTCDLNAISPLLHEHITLIGAEDNEIHTGRQAVLSVLARDYARQSCQLIDWNCSTIAEGKTHVVVSAAYTTSLDTTQQSLHSELSAVWQICTKAPCLIYLHISSRPHTNMVYTYNSRLAVRESGGTVNFLAPQLILYAEAMDMDSILHLCGHRELRVREPFGLLCKRLPSEFYKIHRSFIVNRRHVCQIRRYMVLLSECNPLPIPEKRYSEVYRALTLQ